MESSSVLILILAGFLGIALYKKLLTPKGALISLAFGLFAYFSIGMEALVVMLVFFILAEISTKLREHFYGKKHAIRDELNVIGNGLAGIVALAINAKLAFYAAFACALADTVSSEMGLLSGKQPVLITNLRKKVKPGTDGGITLYGTLASVLGAGIIASLYLQFNANPLGFVIVLLAGFIGCIIDSILGAIYERKKLLDNTQVNLLATSSAAVMAFIAENLIFTLF